MRGRDGMREAAFLSLQLGFPSPCHPQKLQELTFCLTNPDGPETTKSDQKPLMVVSSLPFTEVLLLPGRRAQATYGAWARSGEKVKGPSWDRRGYLGAAHRLDGHRKGLSQASHSK